MSRGLEVSADRNGYGSSSASSIAPRSADCADYCDAGSIETSANTQRACLRVYLIMLSRSFQIAPTASAAEARFTDLSLCRSAVPGSGRIIHLHQSRPASEKYCNAPSWKGTSRSDTAICSLVNDKNNGDSA